jgi:hypothetical protein
MATVCLVPEGINAIDTGDLLLSEVKIDIVTGDTLAPIAKQDIVTGSLLSATGKEDIVTGSLLVAQSVNGLTPLGDC